MFLSGCPRWGGKQFLSKKGVLQFWQSGAVRPFNIFSFNTQVFERKILRRIFGPTQKASGKWRLKTNEELEKAINNENIVR